jgi:stage IV sporulation protein FB
VNGSLRIGSLLGITIRVHVLLLVLIALVLIQADDLWAAAALIGILSAIVLLHELGHSVVARSFGIRVVDITLWPLGGMARMSQIPESPKIEGLIAVAGPIVNFALAFVAALVLGTGAIIGGTGTLVPKLAWYMLTINVMMGAFNLIPAFPMDGGRILRAVLGRGGDWLRATESAVRVGRVIAAMIAMVGFVGMLFFPGVGGQAFIFVLVAAFVWLTGAQELMAVKMRHGVVDLGGLGSPGSFGSFARRAADWSSRARSGERESEARPAAQEAAPNARGFSESEIERLEKFRGPLRGYRVDES